MRGALKSALSAAPALLLFLAACSGTFLQTRTIKFPEDIPGTYTLILYSGPEEGNTVIIMDKAGDLYTFRPYLPEGNYKVMQGVNGNEVPAMAQYVLHYFVHSQNVRIREILDEKGKNVIGYELTPVIFFLWPAGPPQVTYLLEKGHIVRIMIRPNQSVERRDFGFYPGKNPDGCALYTTVRTK
ncbi:MAG: hypothetical protein M0Z59_09125 [Nitrospiraceae bacterium]|nr:hypothetical protein [Nitrospiraceae bacterium]